MLACVHLQKLAEALFTVALEHWDRASERNGIAPYIGATVLGGSFVEHLGNNGRNEINTGGDKTWITAVQQFHNMLVLSHYLARRHRRMGSFKMSGKCLFLRSCWNVGCFWTLIHKIVILWVLCFFFFYSVFDVFFGGEGENLLVYILCISPNTQRNIKCAANCCSLNTGAGDCYRGKGKEKGM